MASPCYGGPESLCNGLDPETHRHEARRADSGGGVLGRDSKPHPISIRGLGRAVGSHSGVRGRAPKNLDFGAFWDLGNHVRMVS